MVESGWSSEILSNLRKASAVDAGAKMAFEDLLAGLARGADGPHVCEALVAGGVFDVCDKHEMQELKKVISGGK